MDHTGYPTLYHKLVAMEKEQEEKQKASSQAQAPSPPKRSPEDRKRPYELPSRIMTMHELMHFRGGASKRLRPEQPQEDQELNRRQRQPQDRLRPNNRLLRQVSSWRPLAVPEHEIYGLDLTMDRSPSPPPPSEEQLNRTASKAREDLAKETQVEQEESKPNEPEIQEESWGANWAKRAALGRQHFQSYDQHQERLRPRERTYDWGRCSGQPVPEHEINGLDLSMKHSHQKDQQAEQMQREEQIKQPETDSDFGRRTQMTAGELAQIPQKMDNERPDHESTKAIKHQETLSGMRENFKRAQSQQPWLDHAMPKGMTLSPGHNQQEPQHVERKQQRARVDPEKDQMEQPRSDHEICEIAVTRQHQHSEPQHQNGTASEGHEHSKKAESDHCLVDDEFINRFAMLHKQFEEQHQQFQEQMEQFEKQQHGEYSKDHLEKIHLQQQQFEELATKSLERLKEQKKMLNQIRNGNEHADKEQLKKNMEELKGLLKAMSIQRDTKAD